MKSAYFFILMTVTAALVGCGGGGGGDAAGAGTPNSNSEVDPSPQAKGIPVCKEQNGTDVVFERDPNRQYQKGEPVSLITKYGPAMRKVFLQLPGEEVQFDSIEIETYGKSDEDGSVRCQRSKDETQDQAPCLRYSCNFTEYQE